jgi:ligand-binding SRPBCC domain-containing protein
MDHRILTDITLDRPIDRVFDFFSDAGNLEAITPPELRFVILTPLPIAMAVGARIDYQLSLYAVPFTWKTRSAPGSRAVASSTSRSRARFRVWIHEHRFEALSPTSTRIRDECVTDCPSRRSAKSPIPSCGESSSGIFSYREERVRALLAG